VAEWQNLAGKNINMLEKYYTEPKRWGLTFQIYAIFTRVEKLHEAIQRYPNKIKISERSILADKYVFSELMKDLGYMDEAEYEVFKSLYGSFEAMTPIHKTKVIYLRCTPEKCHKRTQVRKRA
jgi:deoxyadenosine/deoxycytidine kinase